MSIMKIKALAKLKPEEGIWMTEVDKPELGYNDLLIRIKKTAICGTDVHIYNSAFLTFFPPVSLPS